jgi:predicted ABC-type ATPase
MSNTATSPASRAVIIAGPNGSGKTTFARAFLPSEGRCPTFLNADLIAAGLAPFEPEKANIAAMRLMADRTCEYVRARRDFAVESTLAGRTYQRQIRGWKEQGFLVKIVFLRLDTVEMAIARVQHRVCLGGHHIPEPIIRRRFDMGWLNFQNVHKALVDRWQLYDATKAPPELVDEGVNK